MGKGQHALTMGNFSTEMETIKQTGSTVEERKNMKEIFEGIKVEYTKILKYKL